jgi:TDG/mug DNA glycosylase family protein
VFETPDRRRSSSTKSSFAGVTDAKTRVLVLGSLPGDVSLSRAQYYGHPQNQFWRLIGAVLDVPLVGLDYPERLLALLSGGIGLWDVIASAERSGSLDAAIRNHAPNPVAELAATLPNLRAIAFNGAKAAQLGRRVLGDATPWVLVALPSSSPAHAVAFERKLPAWMQLRGFLQGS